MQSPVDAVTGGVTTVRDLDRLLQDMDINRLRAVVFRDIVSCAALHAAHPLFSLSMLFIE